MPGSFRESVVLFPVDADFRSLGCSAAFQIQVGRQLDFHPDAAGVSVHSLFKADIDVVGDVFAHLQRRDGFRAFGVSVLSRLQQSRPACLLPALSAFLYAAEAQHVHAERFAYLSQNAALSSSESGQGGQFRGQLDGLHAAKAGSALAKQDLGYDFILRQGRLTGKGQGER